VCAGAWNLPLYSILCDPSNTAGLIIDANMHRGFTVEMHDLIAHRRIFFDCPEDLYDLLVFIGTPSRHVIKHVFRRKHMEEPVASTSTSRLSLIAGRYVGKDDPIMIVRCQSGLLAVGEVLEPFARPHLVSGWMRGSHNGPLMPCAITDSHPARFDGPPRVVGMGFQLADGRLIGPCDMLGDISFDRARQQALELADHLRRMGPFEPGRLPLEDMEYTTMPAVAERWEPIEEPAPAPAWRTEWHAGARVRAPPGRDLRRIVPQVGSAVAASGPLTFGLPGHSQFVAPADGVEVERVKVGRFRDGELHVEVPAHAEGRCCVGLGSIAPPAGHLERVTLLVRTLRRVGASRVTALLPYLTYARQDHAAPSQSLGLTGGLLRSSGVDEVACVDVHSDAAAGVLGLPLTSLSPAILADGLPAAWREDVTYVAPDEGAIDRCPAVARAAGAAQAVAWLRKRRTPNGVQHTGVVGAPGRRAVVVDDILDTGGTLVSCCRELRRAGVEQIGVVATPALFTGHDWRAMFGAGRPAAVDHRWPPDCVRASSSSSSSSSARPRRSGERTDRL
jgi:ribose-phosphate pyrophosphokinase